jgi:hypothetical protein
MVDPIFAASYLSQVAWLYQRSMDGDNNDNYIVGTTAGMMEKWAHPAGVRGRMGNINSSFPHCIVCALS